jgi:hypothetical protein
LKKASHSCQNGIDAGALKSKYVVILVWLIMLEWERFFMNKDNEEQYYWEVALSGLGRFFDEGMYTWSKKQFKMIFKDDKVANSGFILDKLKDLEKEGKIAFVGTDDVYIKVLEQID